MPAFISRNADFHSLFRRAAHDASIKIPLFREASLYLPRTDCECSPCRWHEGRQRRHPPQEETTPAEACDTRAMLGIRQTEAEDASNTPEDKREWADRSPKAQDKLQHG